MPNTWKRLAGPLLITNSATTRYTVPALTKTIIRNIHLQNNSASPVDLTISIGTDAAGTRIMDAQTLAADGVLDLYGPFVMETTEILQTNASVTNVSTITITGQEVTLG